MCLWLFPDKISDFLKMFLRKSEQRRDCKSTRSLSEPAYFTNKQPSLRTVLKAARRTKWGADNKLAIYQCQINMCASCLDFNAGVLLCAFMLTRYQNRQQHIVCAPKTAVSNLSSQVISVHGVQTVSSSRKDGLFCLLFRCLVKLLRAKQKWNKK